MRLFRPRVKKKTLNSSQFSWDRYGRDMKYQTTKEFGLLLRSSHILSTRHWLPDSRMTSLSIFSTIPCCGWVWWCVTMEKPTISRPFIFRDGIHITLQFVVEGEPRRVDARQYPIHSLKCILNGRLKFPSRSSHSYWTSEMSWKLLCWSSVHHNINAIWLSLWREWWKGRTWSILPGAVRLKKQVTASWYMSAKEHLWPSLDLIEDQGLFLLHFQHLEAILVLTKLRVRMFFIVRFSIHLFSVTSSDPGTV